jgi:DNA-binding NarL/FixJ family response regulator
LNKAWRSFGGDSFPEKSSKIIRQNSIPETNNKGAKVTRPVRLIFLTVNEDADFARAALDAGGLGYVVKAPLASDPLPAIRA